jgi:hypothetical protein
MPRFTHRETMATSMNTNIAPTGRRLRLRFTADPLRLVPMPGAVKRRSPRFYRFLLPLLLLLALPAVVQAQFIYTINGSAITITGYNGPGGGVSIPSTIDGLPVTTIANHAFSSSTSLTNVTIPDSVISIGIGPFSGCTNLTAITVDELNSAYASVDGVLFDKVQTTLIQCPGGRIGNYTIPSSVTSLRPHAFIYCSSLTGVTIPNSVTSVGVAAFSHCKSLAHVTIGDHVTSIERQAFLQCTHLTSITIPDSVITIASEAFSACSSLTRATIGYRVSWIENYAFLRCANLTGVYFRGSEPFYGGWQVFNDGINDNNNIVVYYLPVTGDWGATFVGCPTAPWPPELKSDDPSFGVQTNRFGFTIAWPYDWPVIIEAATDLLNPVWSPVGTNTLIGGSSYFSDPQWTNSPNRFYRIRLP